MLQLHLLGYPCFELEGKRYELASQKPLYLLLYLAYQGDWVSRAHLATFLYPDEDEPTARHRLRLLLSRLRELPWIQTLEAEPQRLRFKVATDVQAFRAAIQQRDWAKAIQLHQRPLLDKYLIREAPAFDTWLEAEREELRSLWREAVLEAALALGQKGQNKEAAGLLRRVWEQDTFDEQVLQAYLHSLHVQGRRDGALEVFELFKSRLQSELGLAPLPETEHLAEAIRQGRPLDTPPPRAGLPLPDSPLIGRQMELSELSLGAPRLRVLTGLGGVGKTRLALELARQQADQLAQGAYFVSLEGVESLEQISVAIAEALGFTFFGPREPKAQLLDYLKSKEILLVLDHFDHLLEEAGLLAEMLEQAPKLRLLVTSRQHLELPEAWNYPLQGLPPPDPTHLESSEAILFFVQTARRSRPDFKPTLADLQAIAELCSSVEGLPLALELAATWVRELSCAEILEEIRDHQGLLGHKATGMEAVFEHSWHLLSPEQQRLMMALSLFRGGFSRRAAQQVTGASHYLLLSLLGHSLLQKESIGRYRMHSLLQQYAQQKLAQQPELMAHLQHQHALHFVAFLEAQNKPLQEGRWDRVVDEVAVEAENIRLAWIFCLQQRLWPQLESSVAAWGHFLSSRGLYREGQATFAQLAETAQSEEQPLLWAQATQRQGWFGLQLGQTESAKTLLEHSLPHLEQQRHTNGLLYGYNGLGVAWTRLGDYAQAEMWFQKARALAEETQNTASLANTLNSLGNTCRWTGRFAEATEFFRQGLRLAEEIGNQQTTAFLLANLGGALWELGQQQSGQQTTQQAARLAEEIRHWPLLSGCLSNLAEMSFVQKDYAASNDLRQRSLSLRREMGNRRGEAFDTVMLGYNALRLGQPTEAREHFLEGLRIAQEVAARPIQLDALIGLAELELKAEKPTKALPLLLLATQHPATSAEAKGRANQLLSALPLAKVNAARKKAASLELEQVVRQILE
ncbi:AfsR/SARP family transcriptional regulator [Meiothermus hypogaeus]|uniref:Transcriptional activator n=2 Tax=Meiothermus hypogaeus TaxID=884155 RepID=A0A511R4D1_9DEIN|nr:tetratricopeptide repeat protein [Meiothermus hypogaeus]RIH78523.1 putative HTH-type transcriptional regulator [Meiothermus hypogaeus]GEM84454.1 transcriptional activator [Meiothermus hypogaeus NBRC 106114]